MKIIESNLSKHILKSAKTKLANIYFFNKVAVIEFKEGVHLDIENTSEIFEELKTYFGDSRPYGVIANRVNSYSVKLLDMPAFRKKTKNLCTYAVVGHNSASLMNAEIENNFCISTNINYNNIYEAMDNVYRKVKIQVK